MLAVNYSTIRSNLKSYCDKAINENEAIVVTRRGEKNVVILGMDQYNAIVKAAHNAEYLAKIDRGLQQLASGHGQQHDLIEVDDD